MWAQHNGVLASVTVLECHYAGRGETCTGLWHDGSITRSVVIVAAKNPGVGNVVDMRIHGGKAYSTSPLMPALLIGVGAALLGGAGYVVVAARRRAT